MDEKRPQGYRMSREINLLSAVKVAKLKEPGMHHDGGGLYLQIRASGDGVTRSWVYRFRAGDKLRDMGLGSAGTVSLAEARRAAEKARGLRQQGIDPIDARQADRASRASARTGITFEKAAAAYIASHRAGWHNDRHAGQWETTLSTYAYPTIGHLSVADVNTDRVLEVLRPIWTTIPVTADRLRARIEAVLDSAKTLNQRSGENPARWKGHLVHLLQSRSRVRKIKHHHPALPYEQMAAFMTSLRAQDGLAARALEFTILTAARSGEVIGMRWSEIDEAQKMWIVPAERMKGGRFHRVFLSDQALAILNNMRPSRAISPFVFPGAKSTQPMSPTVMLQVIRRMNETANPKWIDPKEEGREVVTHGFRSTFRDWVAEETSFPGDVAEMALAHIAEDEVEAAYRRGDLFEKRRKLMAAWAEYAATGGTI
jgi:integrase